MREAHPYQKNTILDQILEPELICFIVNPHAGSSVKTRFPEYLDKYLNHRKYTYGIRYTDKPGHAKELALKAIEEGYQTIVAVGGDGSINEVASALIGTSARLGILPAGSGNGLAMHLGYGRSLPKAIQLLNRAKPFRIDMGILNNLPFINVAGVGFDGLVSNMMKRSQQRGFWPYLINSVKAGLSYTPKECRIVLPDRTITESCFAVVIANGPMYGYHFTIAPDAKLNDGLFSVVILKDVPRWQYFAALPNGFNGNFYDSAFVEHFSAKELSVYSAGRNFVHMDGEGFELADPLNFKVNPLSLEILVPESYNPF
jgi:YegS/Rv2252/BmrU family lipid kinase